MKPTDEERWNTLVFAVAQIIFGRDAQMEVNQRLVAATLKEYGITLDWVTPPGPGDPQTGRYVEARR